MNDENDINEEPVEDQEPQGPVCGERLAEARRDLQITVVEIAKELHIDEYKVRALESNDFEVLGAPVFAKGHLRKYAQMVKVDEADVIADYYRLERSAAAPSLVPSLSRPRRRVAPGPWLVTIIVVATVASLYWWFTSQSVSPPADAVTRAPAVTTDMTEEVADEAVAIALPDDAATGDLLVETEEAGPEPLPQIASSSGAVAPPPEMDIAVVSLQISYSGDCWTEITDATGRRLFFELGRDGRSVELSGEAPIDVLFGDADNVSFSVDGVSYPISARDRRGKTARLTILAP